MTANVVPIEPALTTLDPQDPWFKYGDGRLHGCFECKPQPRRWFVKDRMLQGRAHLVAGIGGSSKTRLLYALGMGAVLGRLPWSWEVTQTGSAALFLTEDTVDDMHLVVHAMGAHLTEEQRQQVRRQLRVYPLAGLPLRLLQLSGQTLVEGHAYDWIIEQIAKLPQPVAFLGFDPALALTEGDELSPSHQRRLGELMDRIAIDSKACVLLSSHAAKGLRQAEELGSHSSRGSGALTDAVRAEMVLRTMTADEARRFGIDDRVERERYVQLSLTKGNSLPPEAFAPTWLKRGEAGLLEGVTLGEVERGTVGERERKALEILTRAHATGETAMRFWQVQCEAAGLIGGTDSAKEKAMRRIKDALEGAGMVAQGSRRGMWVPA